MIDPSWFIILVIFSYKLIDSMQKSDREEKQKEERKKCHKLGYNIHHDHVK